MRSYFYLDCEMAPLHNAAAFLEDPEPDARLTDPEKIAADIMKKQAAMLERCGLDWNTGRIVAMGWARDNDPIDVITCPSETQERAALKAFWDAWRSVGGVLVGYNVRAYDLPYCIQRSRYLGVPHHKVNLARYRRDPIFDLYDELTFDQIRYGEKPPMRQSLKSFARRFGIPLSDPIDGKDIEQLVKDGDWKGVAEHCRSDVALTRALAQRIGIGQTVTT